MKTASMIIFLAIYFAMGAGLVFSMADYTDVKKGIEQTIKLN